MTPSERVNDLERDLLTLAMTNPNAAEIVAAMAQAAWQNPAHARIAQTIKELFARGESVAVGTVGSVLGIPLSVSVSVTGHHSLTASLPRLPHYRLNTTGD